VIFLGPATSSSSPKHPLLSRATATSVMNKRPFLMARVSVIGEAPAMAQLRAYSCQLLVIVATWRGDSNRISLTANAMIIRRDLKAE
jgi:hypothetical protein